MAFAESRIRAETIAAEDILHDMGAISIVSSDSQAMGRIGEVITRTWQTADKMKRFRGRLANEKVTVVLLLYLVSFLYLLQNCINLVYVLMPYLPLPYFLLMF